MDLIPLLSTIVLVATIVTIVFAVFSYLAYHAREREGPLKPSIMARQRYELWGESIREIGVLLVVFVPLDMLITSRAPNWENIMIFALFGFILIVLGVEIETRVKR